AKPGASALRPKLYALDEIIPVVLFIDRMVPNCLLFSCFSIITDFRPKSSISPKVKHIVILKAGKRGISCVDGKDRAAERHGARLCLGRADAGAARGHGRVLHRQDPPVPAAAHGAVA